MFSLNFSVKTVQDMLDQTLLSTFFSWNSIPNNMLVLLEQHEQRRKARFQAYKIELGLG